MTMSAAVIEEAAQALYESAPNNTRPWSALPDDMKEIHRRRARIVADILIRYWNPGDRVPQ